MSNYKEKNTKGWVYVLSNPSLSEDTYKVGMTTRNVDERVKELNSSTSIPQSFHVEYKVACEDPYGKEQEIHRRLRGKRINKKREFFTLPLSFIIDVVNDVCEVEDTLDVTGTLEEFTKRFPQVTQEGLKQIAKSWVQGKVASYMSQYGQKIKDVREESMGWQEKADKLELENAQLRAELKALKEAKETPVEIPTETTQSPKGFLGFLRAFKAA